MGLYYFKLFPSKIKWDLTNGPLSEVLLLVELWKILMFFRGPWNVGPTVGQISWTITVGISGLTSLDLWFHLVRICEVVYVVYFLAIDWRWSIPEKHPSIGKYQGGPGPPIVINGVTWGIWVQPKITKIEWKFWQNTSKIHGPWQGTGLPMMALPPAESMTSAQLGRAALSISRSPGGAFLGIWGILASRFWQKGKIPKQSLVVFLCVKLGLEMGINWVGPPPSNSGKWRFRLGSPTKHETILVVTITGKGGNPRY